MKSLMKEKNVEMANTEPFAKIFSFDDYFDLFIYLIYQTEKEEFCKL